MSNLQPIEVFDGIRVFLCLAFFIYASWSDLKKREVSNKVWVVLAPPAFTLTVLRCFMFAQESLNIYALSFAITSALSVTLFYAGAFGGADAKALICLSIALPSYPETLFQPRSHFIPFFPITVFTNAVLLAAFTSLYIILRNLLWRLKASRKLFEGFGNESFGRKALTLISGYKVSASELQKKAFLFPLEDVERGEAGDFRRLVVFPKDEERNQIVERLLGAVREEKIRDEVWATPGLPMLIFITAGLIVALFFGDLVWAFCRFMLG